MKRSLLIFSLLLTFSLPLQAVELLSTLVDGTKVFRCEYLGDQYKVSVKFRGNGVYTVLRFGQGTTGASGDFNAPNAAAAAAKGCGTPK